MKRVLTLASFVLGLISISAPVFAQCAAYGTSPNDNIPDGAALNAWFQNNANICGLHRSECILSG